MSDLMILILVWVVGIIITLFILYKQNDKITLSDALLVLFFWWFYLIFFISMWLTVCVEWIYDNTRDIVLFEKKKAPRCNKKTKFQETMDKLEKQVENFKK